MHVHASTLQHLREAAANCQSGAPSPRLPASPYSPGACKRKRPCRCPDRHRYPTARCQLLSLAATNRADAQDATAVLAARSCSSKIAAQFVAGRTQSERPKACVICDCLRSSRLLASSVSRANAPWHSKCLNKHEAKQQHGRHSEKLLLTYCHSAQPSMLTLPAASKFEAPQYPTGFTIRCVPGDRWDLCCLVKGVGIE